MGNETSFLLGLLTILVLLAKQLHTSEKMQKDVVELKHSLGIHAVYLKYIVLYAAHSSDLAKDKKSALDLNMNIDLECVGLDAMQAARLDEEKRAEWKEFNEALKNVFHTTK